MSLENLYNMLKSSAQADIDKAKLSLSLLGENAVGIGDHSTEDFYKNAEEALSLLCDGEDRLKVVESYLGKEIQKKSDKENRIVRDSEGSVQYHINPLDHEQTK
jgi:hypothetical protein